MFLSNLPFDTSTPRSAEFTQMHIVCHRFIVALATLGFLSCIAANRSSAAEPALPRVTDVELQPLVAQARRVVQALDLLGSPLTKGEQEALDRAYSATDSAAGVAGVQDVL